MLLTLTSVKITGPTEASSGIQHYLTDNLRPVNSDLIVEGHFIFHNVTVLLVDNAVSPYLCEWDLKYLMLKVQVKLLYS